MSDCLSVYVTTPSFDVADTIGRALVEERRAACVNIFPSMHSIYRRQGKIETAIEVVLIAKSRGRPFRGKASPGTAPLRLPLPCRRVTIA